ncbi:hypothetical protein EJ03DRAFT_324174 [Teratosphaeria nubilosa]|uniref:Uncharacterized protein n=1 Tax=Teratosphaeria nubilosa TaxID=161662 RepID=A0A6G1LJK3_9PEZI|nr:hypothetical protein EJ03DRAFT_324174 [Teratosphaeria nubilosa]
MASPLDLSACLHGRGSFQHPLTQTCSQIRSESLQLFYSSTDFELDEKHEIATSELGYFEEIPEAIDAALWLFSVDPAHVDLIRSIGFRNGDKIMSRSRYLEYVAEEAQKGQIVGIGERMVGNYHIVCSNGTGTLVKAYRKVLCNQVHLVARLVDVTAEDRIRPFFASPKEPGERASMQWRLCGLVVVKTGDSVDDLGGLVAKNEKMDECLLCRLCVGHGRMNCPAEFDEEDPFVELSPTNETYQPFCWEEGTRTLNSTFAPIFESMMESVMQEDLLGYDESDEGSERPDSEGDSEESSDADMADDMGSEDDSEDDDSEDASEEASDGAGADNM